MSDKISVFLADDHALLAEGIGMILEAQPDMLVVGRAQDGMQAVEECKRLRPQVLLVDISLPKLSGFDVAFQITETCPETKVVFLTKHESAEMVARAVKVGASGYVVKTNFSNELLTAIRYVARGLKYFCPLISQHLLSDYGRRLQSLDAGADPAAALSNRERQVLQLVAEGNSSPQIAEQLFLSVKAIEKIRQRIMKKLEVKDVANMVRAAIRMGLTTN